MWKARLTDGNGFMHVSEGQLYAATVADFSGGEPLIHREKIRTERSDLNQLNGKPGVDREARMVHRRGVAICFRDFVNSLRRSYDSDPGKITGAILARCSTRDPIR